MHSPAMSFQFLLLNRMSASYRAAVLSEVGISETEAARIRRTCKFRIPQELGSDLLRYTDLLGPPLTSEQSGPNVPPALSGCTAHQFGMPLWPHLYWTVHSGPDGSTSEVGFRNQVEQSLSCDPSLVRRGVWTRSALESVASRVEVHDGWDEEVVLRLELAGGVYQASFMFGLLQDWRQVPPTAKQDKAG